MITYQASAVLAITDLTDVKKLHFYCSSRLRLSLLLPRSCCQSCQLSAMSFTEGSPLRCDQVFLQDHVPTQKMGAYRSFHRHDNVTEVVALMRIILQ
jgi:hypothetical protein